MFSGMSGFPHGFPNVSAAMTQMTPTSLAMTRSLMNSSVGSPTSLPSPPNAHQTSVRR
jgi:hypothetical protein